MLATSQDPSAVLVNPTRKAEKKKRAVPFPCIGKEAGLGLFIVRGEIEGLHSAVVEGGRRRFYILERGKGREGPSDSNIPEGKDSPVAKGKSSPQFLPPNLNREEGGKK